MKFLGEMMLKAPREDVFNALRDARFFASCIDGVRQLTELSPDRYAAVFETRVAYMKFSFKVTVELTLIDPPNEIRATIEGTPFGMIGRLTASSLTRLDQLGDETHLTYEIDANLTGKLGSLGQPVLRSKAKDMDREFAARLRAAFDAPAEAVR
jgi:carbon monoxide dehydrogenase subunit G